MKKLIVVISAIFLLIITLSSIRLYNCARVDDIITIKWEIRDFVDPEVIDEQINHLEKIDYFNAVEDDIIEVRRRNEQNKKILGY